MYGKWQQRQASRKDVNSKEKWPRNSCKGKDYGQLESAVEC